MHKVWLKDCTFCCHCALCFGSRWRTVTFEEETKEEDSSPARHASVWMHLSVFINLYVLMCMSICWEPCYFVIGWRVKLIDHCVSLQCLHQACTSASHSLSEAFMFSIYNTRDVLDCELNTFPQPKNLKKICILQLKTISPRGSFSGYSGAFFISFFFSTAVSNVKNELSTSAPVALFERARMSFCTAFPRIHLSVSVSRTVTSSFSCLLFEVCVLVAVCSALIASMLDT